MIDPKTEFDLTKHLYLVEIYQQTAKEMAVKKAGQVCISEWLISYAFNCGDERDMNVLYLMPTDGDVSDFSQSRFGPALEASPYLDSIVIPATGGRRGSDKVSLKRVRNSFLYLRGGHINRDVAAGKSKGEHRLKSIPVDALIMDEIDEIPPVSQALARERLGHSEVAEVRCVSTPTYAGVGIDVLWKESDQREWMIPCPHCGMWQCTAIDHIVIEWDDLERPVAWHGQDDEQAFPACEKCGKELNRLAQGAWVARYPGRPVVGYHPTKFSSYVTDLNNIIEKLCSTDETKRQECFNQDLGETYTPRGGQLTAEILDECLRDYGHGPAPGDTPFMGVDVGSVLHVVIRSGQNQETGEYPQRFASEVESFDELGRLMKRYKVKQAVIDALPETKKAREFQAGFPPGVVWLAYYQDDAKRDVSLAWDEREGTVNMDRTWSLDEAYARFYEGLNTLPANGRAIPDYYDHLTAPVRILVDKRGHKVARYVESKPDHFAHAENYCRAAMLAPQKKRHKFAAV